VLQHQLAGPVLVGGGRHDQGAHWEAGHVDCHNALGALGFGRRGRLGRGR
jgi:hypothetical protein